MKNTAIILLGIAAYLGGFLLAYAAEESVEAPTTKVVPATQEKTFDQIVLSRTSYVHPGTGYGTLSIRVTRGRYLSVANGYELADEAPTHLIELDVKQTAARSTAFRNTWKAYNDSLRLLAMENYYTIKRDELLAADSKADTKDLDAKLTGLRAKLGIEK